MTPILKFAAGAALALCAVAAQAAGDTWTLPVKTHTLENGLTVVVSEDHTSPTVGVSVVYKIGMRREPEGRTGFAHLFEHMMFQGTPTAPKGVAVASSLAGLWIDGRAPEDLGQYTGRVRAVTAADVQDVARRYFKPQDQSLVVVGDPAVAEQLKAFGEFEAVR